MAFDTHATHVQAYTVGHSKAGPLMRGVLPIVVAILLFGNHKGKLYAYSFGSRSLADAIL